MKTTKAVLFVSACLSLGTVWGEVATTVPGPKNEVFVTLTRTDISQKDLPSNTQVLTPEEFKGWSAQTAGEAARRMTSVQVNSVGSLGSVQTMQIRGASTSQNLLLIDGRPVGGVAFGSSQDLTEIPVEQIDHIEVVRGGASALYGPNAIGGVLNVITRRGPSDGNTETSAGYEYGSYGRAIFRANLGSKTGPVDYFLYGNSQHEKGFRANGQADTQNVGANLGFNLFDKARLTVDGSFYEGETGVPGLSFISPNQFNNDIERRATTPHAKQDTDTKALRTALAVPLPMNSLVTARFWGSQRSVIFKDDFSNTDLSQISKGGSLQAELPLGFMVGGDFIHDHEDNTDHLTTTNSFGRFAENYGFFAQDTMKWKIFTLIPSGRFDHHSAFGSTANPRVQAMADATPWLRFSGSSARAFRAPTIDDLYYPFTDFGTFANDFTDPFSRNTRFTYQGNPNLRPETAWTYDAGIELHNESASIKATYFRANVRNLIQTVNTFTLHSGTFLDPDVFASNTVNVGYARRQGLEIQTSHTWNAYFKDGLNYTYLNNMGKPSGFNDYVVLAYSPRHTANWWATISPCKSVDFTNNLRYVDSRYSSNDQTGTKLGHMLLWDIRLAYRWKILESYFQVSDVTDKRYIEQSGFPLPGRTYIGGVTVHFGGPAKQS